MAGDVVGTSQRDAQYAAIQEASARLMADSNAAASPGTEGGSVLRVAQLDSERLTIETYNQFRQQVRKAVQYLNVAGWELELDTVLGLLLFRHTVWNNHQTYGDRLQNIIYRSDARARALGKFKDVRFSNAVAPTTREKVLLCVASVLVPYIYGKLVKKSQDDGWGDLDPATWQRRAHDLLYQIETVVRVASLVNLIVFIREGKFRHVIDRLLGLRLVTFKSKVKKLSSFEFMDRQLWWRHVTEFLTFILPFVNFLPWLKRLFRTRTARTQVVNTTTCPVCMLNPIQIAAVTNCGHHFCYYCISSRVRQQAAACPVCSEPITSISRPQTRR
eukprot:TRINITY_DN12093_c0_g2_i1.p2 TRINITY_DN12093_c0_g2~~TRINITY_DN12093_c0_g2_i1.p2  ORF type:complete len:353 (+),score=108.11 TRINITY_DN12093_c0_g2_i1:68-1060(+)